jgi:GMP synthase-like glutamine amidotransferase
MKIGLLQCYHVDAKYMGIDGDLSDMFVRLFGEHTPEVTLEIYDVINGQFPESLYECDGFIISGSLHSVYDDMQWIHDLAAFVRQLYEAQHPTVGICFGHQMIAQALGGEVKKSERGFGLGIRDVTIDNPKSWMQPDLLSYNLLYFHEDQVETLPNNGEVIAGNEHCPIAAFSVGEYMLGIQGHPEFSTKFVETMMTSDTVSIDEGLIDVAKTTFARPTHEGDIMDWIRLFFAQKANVKQ